MIINDLDGYYIVFDTKNWNTELDTLVNLYLFSSIPLYFKLDAAKITLFSWNHQEKSKKSASYQQITTRSTINY